MPKKKLLNKKKRQTKPAVQTTGRSNRLLQIIKHKNTRIILLIILVFTIIYLVYSYFPLLQFKLQGGDQTRATLNTSIEQFIADNNEVIPDKNTLIIPKIGVKAEILEGSTLAVLDKAEGVWREPQTSNPTLGGNMVIAGHRRQFLPPNTSTFYLLPELKVDDYIIVYWEKSKYVYLVSQVLDTNKYDQIAYQKTDKDVITLYTCIPLETANSRFVVKAVRIN